MHAASRHGTPSLTSLPNMLYLMRKDNNHRLKGLCSLDIKSMIYIGKDIIFIVDMFDSNPSQNLPD